MDSILKAIWVLFCFVFVTCIFEATEIDSFLPSAKLMCETTALLCQFSNNIRPFLQKRQGGELSTNFPQCKFELPIS